MAEVKCPECQQFIFAPELAALFEGDEHAVSKRTVECGKCLRQFVVMRELRGYTYSVSQVVPDGARVK